MRSTFARGAALAASASCLLVLSALARVGYYATSDVHGDRIVFSSEGDLWTVSASGGTAERLTSHPGTESLPRFSPDGKWVAFKGLYDGNADVFVIPVEGGEPRRLTYHPGPEDPVTWTPDGRRLVIRSWAYHPTGNFELFTIPAEGGDLEPVPIGWASSLAIDETTGRWAFARSYWETATWKRYRGGTAPDLWVGHPERNDFRNVTNFNGLDHFPMWHAGKLYYLCDRGGTANIWSMEADGTGAKALTHEETWDVRWPAIGPEGKIVYALAGDLYLLETQTGNTQRLAIELPSERLLARTRYPASADFVTEVSIAPEGDRLALVSRGEIFSVPVLDPTKEKNGKVTPGIVLPITRGSRAREHGVGFSGDGERVTFISDGTGEEAIVTADAWGRGTPATVVPAGETGWHFPPVWSPNDKWIAYADQTFALYIVPASGGSPILVDRAPNWEITEFTWSPDGRYLAYAMAARTDYRSIHIYDVQTRTKHALTAGATDDFSPAWDPNGEALYFLSNRASTPAIAADNFDFNYVVPAPTLVYMALLRPDVKNPYLPSEGLPGGRDDEKKKEDDEEKGKSSDEKDEDKIEPVVIDFTGLPSRVVNVPISPGRYFGLGASKKNLFFYRGSFYAEEDDDGGGPQGVELLTFDLETRETSTFAGDVTLYELARKKDLIVVRKADGLIAVVESTKKPEDLSKHAVSIGDVIVELDPAQEWEQMYHEAWRVMRDFYWDGGMAGLDWKALGDQYASLLPRIGTLAELNDLIGQLIGELGTSHTYIWGGDPGVSVSWRSTGLLGADVKREGAGYRVTRIYRGDPADHDRSPLEEPGARVEVGEFIRAVNHRPFSETEPFEAAFENLAGRPVVLTVGDRASGGTTRDVVVTPLASDQRLRYIDWVRRNREYVAEKTGGKIGYLHLPDMGMHGLTEFERWFYTQLDKEGLVIDERWNGGGFVSELVLDRIRRRPQHFGLQRNGARSTYPYRALNGPLVVLINEFAGSDGDIFPSEVKKEGIGLLIGTRTWGGVVGIRGDKTRVDGGMVTQPEFALWDPRSGWAIENYGVDPDIEVINTPQDLAKGKDAQLDRAIDEIMRLHKDRPPIAIAPGPKPTKRRTDFRNE